MSSGQGPLSFPAYRRLFIARAVSSAGSYMQIVAATWFVYKLTGSAASVRLLSALALGPSIVGGPIGGALVDRYDPRRLAIHVLYVLQAIPAAIMAILDFTGELPLGWLYALVFAGAVPCPASTVRSSVWSGRTRCRRGISAGGTRAVVDDVQPHPVGRCGHRRIHGALDRDLRLRPRVQRGVLRLVALVLAGTTLLSEVRPCR